ncbi:MAG: hypothetical protein KAW19_12290 [Candidatus Aminicenantes bacterium]|nr:hypothetical protein [Candidatus Aminicenantes bacterium]
MKMQKRLNLDFASHPLKNRRLFYLLFTLLTFVFLFVSIIAGNVYFKYGNKVKNIKASVAKVDKMIKGAQRQEKRFTTQIKAAEETLKSKIDLINTLILGKSFSWIDFLSDLEKSLPDSCYIVSLAPSLKEDATIEVRLEVASPNLDEILKLITRLNSMPFKRINLVKESKKENGFLLSEISLIYERNI